MQIKKNYNHILLKNGWFNTWIRSLWRYFILFVLVITVSHFIFYHFGLLHTNVDSARYLLSALIQSEAAIVAIVITLSLVAAQLAAASYSTRVIEVFINYKKNPEPLILLLIYGSAMFWGLGVLKLIEVDNSYLNNQSNLEIYISFSYYLGIFAFMALVPYIKNTLELLKPSTLFNVLAKRITKQNILDFIGGEQKKNDNEDPVRPIVDIIRGALMKYDYETVRDGLRTIGNSVNSMFQNEEINEKEDENISKHIFVHLTRVGSLAVIKDDTESTLEILTILHKNGMTAMEQRLKYAGRQATVSIGIIGTAAAKQSLNDITVKSVKILAEIGKDATKQELYEVTKQVVFDLEDIGKVAVEQKLENVISRVIESLLKICDDDCWEVACSLNNIGQKTVQQNLSDATKQVAFAIGTIGKAAAVDNTDTTYEVVEYLEGIANAATEKRLKDVTEVAINLIGEIGIVLATQKQEDATKNIIKILENFEKSETIQKLEISNLQIKELIEKIHDA